MVACGRRFQVAKLGFKSGLLVGGDGEVSIEAESVRRVVKLLLRSMAKILELPASSGERPTVAR